MAYRAPRYSYFHAGRDVGASAITLDGDSAHADFPVDNLIDDRASTLFQFSAVVNNPNIVVDLGADYASMALNRVIIPANHDIESLRVWQADDAAYTQNNEQLVTLYDTTPGVLIDAVFDMDPFEQTRQFLRLAINSAAGQTQNYLPQLIYTKTVTLGTGVALADSPDGKIDNVTRLERNSGQSPTIQHGPQQRVIEYEYESPLEGADLTAMEALVNSVGMVRPFWVDPAEFHATPGTDEPALWMKFADMPESRNSILVPMNGERSKVYRLRLIESLD
jgi:hypothetical protein